MRSLITIIRDTFGNTGVRERECAQWGHRWSIILKANGTVTRVLCEHCGTDSGLRRPTKESAS